MKITENDLDNNILSKLNQLESLKNNNAVGQSTAYIAYENGAFVKKAINELNLNKVFDTDEIFEMKKHACKSEDNFISAYDTCIISESGAYATSALLSKISGEFAFKLESNVVKIKTYQNYIYALCNNGVLYKIDRLDYSVVKSKNVLEVIKMNYVYQNFDIFSITDFDYYSDGVLLSTLEHGVFFVSLEREESSVAVQELYIDHIKVLPDRKTLLLTRLSNNNSVVLFNLELGTKIAVYNHLCINRQDTLSIDVNENDFYILGKSYGINQSEHLIHHWKLDEAGINYENLDRHISKNPSDNSYRPKFIKSDKTNVYVIGTKGNHLFIWEYIKENMTANPVELVYELQDISYDSIKDFININNKFYITLDNKLLVLNKDFKLLENYQLNDKTNFKSIKITTSGVFAMYEKECYLFYIPEKVYHKTVDLSIIDDDADCNNIDIMIKAPMEDTLLFLNGDTNQKIVPYLYVKEPDENYHIVKLMNCNADNIILRVSMANEKDKIESLVIHKDRIFYK